MPSPTQPSTATRQSAPSGSCPASSWIDARLLALSAAFRTVVTDSDDRAAALDAFTRAVPTAVNGVTCMTQRQIAALDLLVEMQGAQSQEELDSFSKGIAGLIGGVVDSAAAVGDFLGKLLKAETWVRVAEVIVGVILILLGIQQLMKVLGADVTKYLPMGGKK